ncbi:hypothetical protein [Lysinibacillus sp. NPDC093692]
MRKRSSNVAAASTNVFCSESEATATKRPIGTEINTCYDYAYAYK